MNCPRAGRLLAPVACHSPHPLRIGVHLYFTVSTQRGGSQPHRRQAKRRFGHSLPGDAESS